MENINSQPGQKQRRNFYIEKGFQKKLIIQLTLLVVGTILVANGAVFIYFKLLPESNVSTAIQATVQAAQGNSTNFIEMFWLPALIVLLLGILSIPIIGLFYSHRIAGPLFNLKRMLTRVENGKLDQMMHIRNTDEFHDIEYSFNQMIKGLNRKLVIFKNAIAQMPDPGRKKMEQLFQEYFALAPGDSTEDSQQ
jgi:nitrogen fixation/metabolism regulation signal transduction histidine kinase